MSSEDEPEEFEWGRLTELQRRNTLYPAHLKSVYPVEMLPVESVDKVTDDRKTKLTWKRKNSEAGLTDCLNEMGHSKRKVFLFLY